MDSAAAKDRLPKVDTLSASVPKRPKAIGAATHLTETEEEVVRAFVAKGKALDQSMGKAKGELVALAIKVRDIFFSKKARGTSVMFEGHSYTDFENFVERNFPVSGRTMRRWLAEEGKTDTRFANKQQDDPLPASAPAGKLSKPSIAEIAAEKEARIKSVLGCSHNQILPEIVVRAYDAGWRQGYQEALADADKRRGRA